MTNELDEAIEVLLAERKSLAERMAGMDVAVHALLDEKSRRIIAKAEAWNQQGEEALKRAGFKPADLSDARKWVGTGDGDGEHATAAWNEFSAFNDGREGRKMANPHVPAYVKAWNFGRKTMPSDDAPDLSDAQKQQIDAANAEYVQATGQAVAVEIPEGDGWVEHDGSAECPVDLTALVEVISNPGFSPYRLSASASEVGWQAVAAYRILQAPETPASEQDASGQGEPQTDAGSAPYAAQGDLNGIPKGFTVWEGDSENFGPSLDLLSYLPMVEVVTRSGSVFQHPFDVIRWKHLGVAGDVIAYRFVGRAYPAVPAPILTPEPQTYTTETGLTLAPGEVLPDPALHPEHDGTGYWSGNVDGETP